MLHTLYIILAAVLIGASPASAQQTIVKGALTFGSSELNYAVLRDSLHLNTIQAVVQERDGTVVERVLHNTGGLRVLGISLMTYALSFGQRLEYDPRAEPNPVSNFFAARNGTIDADGRVLPRGSAPGYLVKDAYTRNEYHYGARKYSALFRMKAARDASIDPDTPVARLEVYCLTTDRLLVSDVLTMKRFTRAGWQTFEEEFSLAAGASPCTETDLRVYSYGAATLWLDRVTVQDSIARGLFTNEYSKKIRADIGLLRRSGSLLERVYVNDEPYLSSFLSIRALQAILDTVPGGDRVNVITSVTDNYAKFAKDAGTREMLIDNYPITADIPSPVLAGAEARECGITPFAGADEYNTALQTQIDKYFIGHLKAASEAAQQASPRKYLWYVPQAHGEYMDHAGGFRWPAQRAGVTNSARRPGSAMLRPPTANELILLCNMGIAFGARGILPYPLTASRDENFMGEPAHFPGLLSGTKIAGVYADHYSNYDSFPSPTGMRRVWVGYRDKWNALAAWNQWIDTIGHQLMLLTWEGTRGWARGETTQSGKWTDVVTAVDARSAASRARDEQPSVQVARFTDGKNDYLYVVNRRCDPGAPLQSAAPGPVVRQRASDARDITLTLHLPGSGAMRVADLVSGRSWSVEGGSGTLTLRLDPAAATLLKLTRAA